ncbi:MAG TPA: GreA/GreB family elongation factor [Candidatus Pacearchaeota archaeon]|nr:GreA/GreB family elongation factor [Candidatus Parcubacteria bacterium]HNP79331.1 GreA/GreB family elongation factor [Candidatus Pacearchaeota archaeon]HQM24596.1 GreA/GreB family elongation factor [Candidatus Pacearchaeota archaeon]
MHQYYVTKKKLRELEEELENLKKIKREEFQKGSPAVFEGEDVNPDFAFYQDSLEELDMRIEELENVLKNYIIIKAPQEKDKVCLGAKVIFKDGSASENEFKIVGTLEANPFEGKISNESPIGMALLGKRVGDIVSVGNNNSYRIVKINYEEG